MIIDSLTHIMPKEVSLYIEKYKKIDKKFDSIFDKNSKIINCEELIMNMKNNKIDKSIVGGFGWTDHGLATIVNDYILDSAQKNHNLIPLCSLDINSKKSEEELIKCISKGVKGIGELHLEYDESFEKTVFGKK